MLLQNPRTFFFQYNLSQLLKNQIPRNSLTIAQTKLMWIKFIQLIHHYEFIDTNTQVLIAYSQNVQYNK
jgi:hypothetical protein